jgi:hypothetical protein
MTPSERSPPYPAQSFTAALRKAHEQSENLVHRLGVLYRRHDRDARSTTLRARNLAGGAPKFG